MTPTLTEVRDDLLKLAMKVEELRFAEGSGSTHDVMEWLALDLGHHYERIRDEIKALKIDEMIR